MTDGGACARLRSVSNRSRLDGHGLHLACSDAPTAGPPDASIPPTGHQAAGGGARTYRRPSSIGAVFEPTQLAWIPACAGMTERGAGMTERARNDGGGRGNDGGGRGNDGEGRGNDGEGGRDDGEGACAQLRSVSNRSRLHGHGLHPACSDAPAAGRPTPPSRRRATKPPEGALGPTGGRPASAPFSNPAGSPGFLPAQE